MKLKDNGCIYCDRSSKGLMICCDRCEIWYHYKCVNKKWDLGVVDKKALHCLLEYYCYPCRRAIPSLKLRYFSAANFDKNCITTRNTGPDRDHCKTFKKSHKNKPPPNQVYESVEYPQLSSSSSSSSPSSSNSSYTSSHTSESDLPEYKSDDAAENKQPNRTKSIPTHPIESPCASKGKKQQPQQHQQHQQHQQNQQQQQQQPQDSHSGQTGRKSDKMSEKSNRRALKKGRARLKSKIQKAMRRQRLPTDNFL